MLQELNFTDKSLVCHILTLETPALKNFKTKLLMSNSFKKNHYAFGIQNKTAQLLPGLAKRYTIKSTCKGTL